MNRQDMLASLIAQGAQEGSDLTTLRAIVEEASELGADRVLARLGLADDGAQGDIDELRELLQAWRDAKKSAWRAAVAWAARGLLAMLLVGFAWRFGLTELLR
ncbi:DUF6127 family protein [Altererythrobacter fulvus]|uniref:DUF6127 family protein n=1 Tax=Caenibius fulvus TaxID=2126012 RepID=UPI003016160A